MYVCFHLKFSKWLSYTCFFSCFVFFFSMSITLNLRYIEVCTYYVNHLVTSISFRSKLYESWNGSHLSVVIKYHRKSGSKWTNSIAAYLQWLLHLLVFFFIVNVVITTIVRVKLLTVEIWVKAHCHIISVQIIIEIL